MAMNYNIVYHSLCLIALFSIKFTYSAKILHFYSIGCKSTSLFHQTISEILIHHGHEIIGLSPFPVKHLPNYTDIEAHDKFLKFTDAYSITDDVTGTYINMKISFETQHANCENIYKDSKVVNLLDTLKIDLVIFEVDAADCFIPLVARFNVPIIGIGTSNSLTAEYDGLLGNPVNPSYIPTTMSGFSTKMNFFQRLENTKNYLLHWILKLYYLRQANSIVAKYLESPPIEELYHRISLVFYNSHFSFIPRPISPTSVGIAGIHIREASSLPKKVENFINDVDEGVIYLSLGSVVKFSELPVEIQNAFVNVFSKLPFRILWRHDKPEMLTNIPENILPQKWFPQKDILAHKNTRLFISHCGMLSTYEAIHFGVPLIAFPVIFDQFTNAAIVESLGIGLSLDLRNFNETSMLLSIREILNNFQYHENMKKVSSIFKDRPQSPEESFMYWVEYVLKHKNVSYLYTAGSRLPFHQYLLLDVIAFLFAQFFFMCCIIYFVLYRYLYRNIIKKYVKSRDKKMIKKS